jgi:hypothetical protein
MQFFQVPIHVTPLKNPKRFKIISCSVHFSFPPFLTNMAKRLLSKPAKAKARQGTTTKMDIDTAELLAPTATPSNGLPGVFVDEKSGPCTVQLKGKSCSCQRYSEANPRDSKNPGCRECTHGHSAHNGRRPNGDEVHSIVRNVLHNKHNQDNRREILAPFKAAQQESNSGYRFKDKVRAIHVNQQGIDLTEMNTHQEHDLSGANNMINVSAVICMPGGLDVWRAVSDFDVCDN